MCCYCYSITNNVMFFQNLKKLFTKNGLHHASFVSWISALGKTDTELKLGGVTRAIKHYPEGNNSHMINFYPSKLSSSVMYLGFNNQYKTLYLNQCHMKHLNGLKVSVFSLTIL